ncbi:hypothetical protein CW304_21305 [Bacillus sp. UFRGS-B20]|nr:hypothetical protein CW304_21305 [Bacillus sp. UFRGS-B20]
MCYPKDRSAFSITAIACKTEFCFFHGTHKARVSDKKILPPFLLRESPRHFCFTFAIRIYPFRIDYYQMECLDGLKCLEFCHHI